MPELPDVEEFLHYFKEHAMEKEITDVEVFERKSLRNTDEDELRDVLVHDSFESAERYGKWLIIDTKKGNCLALHFGMTGYLEFTDKDNTPHSARVSIEFNKDQKLFFVDQRIFGRIELIKNKKDLIEEHNLGTDALDMEWNEFKDLFKKKRGFIKNALMDQKTISGIGNIYADEILFQVNIHPKSDVSNLSDKQLKDLFNKIQKVLKTAIEHHADHDDFPENYLIPHRKKGKSWSACDGEIETIKVSGRTTYFCPEVQKKL